MEYILRKTQKITKIIETAAKELRPLTSSEQSEIKSILHTIEEYTYTAIQDFDSDEEALKEYDRFSEIMLQVNQLLAAGHISELNRQLQPIVEDLAQILK